jgi:hypothetical protein
MRPTTVPGAAHRVEWMIASGRVEGRVTCFAVLAAPCRLTCGVGCDTWDTDSHEHDLVDAGECMLLPWLDNSDEAVAEYYAGEPGPLRDGPVILTWANDGLVTWDYEGPGKLPIRLDFTAQIHGHVHVADSLDLDDRALVRAALYDALPSGIDVSDWPGAVDTQRRLNHELDWKAL